MYPRALSPVLVTPPCAVTRGVLCLGAYVPWKRRGNQDFLRGDQGQDPGPMHSKILGHNLLKTPT